MKKLLAMCKAVRIDADDDTGHDSEKSEERPKADRVGEGEQGER